MSYASFADEVAEDYRKALEDLTMNSRYEISNLTVIAKENTEHAPAISDALKNHIKRTAPAKKLPAFYVLDSVVKNVGTPYTLFFGRGLYSTFMEAYAVVDSNTRRKMEEMLKTWKEPVPGSIDTRPVFPSDVTRPIETALIKARTSALQAHQEFAARNQQQLSRARPGMQPTPTPYRETPTPPGVIRHVSQAPGYVASYGYVTNPSDQQYGGTLQIQQPYGASQYAPPSTPLWQAPSQDSRAQDASIDTLNSDIADLITVSRSDFAQNPYDNTIQTRLKALLDLQSILQNQKLPPEQLAQVRDQVTKLSTAARPPPAQAPVPIPVPVTQQPLQHPTLASLLGQGGLAALLARSASATPQIPTPPTQVAVPIRSPQPQYTQPSSQVVPPAAPPTQAATPDPTSLLERLRAAGMLPATPAATSTPPIPTSALSGTVPPGFPPSLAFLGNKVGVRPVLAEIPNDVQLDPRSLKIPRPHLISMLYERLGLPCTQCGRRFQSDEEGRKRKTAHMDWHFRVHQRMTEAERRGQHRSWYVDELDWIKSRESEDDHLASSANGTTTLGGQDNSAAAKAPKLQYIPVPDNPPNTMCPICQEKFEMKWLDEAQEFVWMDAIKIGGRIYHASCHSEVKRDGATPEPVLGKRKNEDDHMTLRTKIKTEPAY